ncbi:XAC2610-related protein [Stenotrophomonas rhizophila]|uniref:XAC2610-related protein n=1 Tax=Stenotrophomonas rhizophila TaxID=216778 RepID=UPI0004567CF0|nr:hypothetical protein [Stenotrophomonas rhizophila]AHY59005.1 hypothetical protein DX03_10020 [Stenotrophomonas rhizophila]
MAFLLPALALAVAGSTLAAPDLLQPGLYALQPDAHLLATPATPAAGESYQQRYEHAVPAAARVRYAFVSRDPQTQLNKLVFVTDAAYRYDINSANLLCPAYAFPDWNAHSDAQPYCRTNIGANDREAALDWTATAFSVRWADRKQLQGTVQVPPQRAPTAEEAGACAIADVCAADAYGRHINQYEVVHYSDRFTLQQPREYVDVLHVDRALPLHAQASDAGSVATIAAGSYLAVLQRTPAWYRVEQIDPDGNAVRGWIDRDAVSTVTWVAQAAVTPEATFRVGVERDEDGVRLTAIEVLDARTGQRRQVLRDFEADPVGDADALLQVVDVNFDGHPDLLAPGLSGGAGPNNTTNVFLFDPASGTFVHDATLSDLPQLSINAQDRSITSASRGGCCSHASETYRYRDGTLQMVGSWEESLSADGEHVETTRGTWRNGRMQYRTTRARATPDGP